MATEAQFAANRANAEHSTGPRTDEGKARSCKNNLRWGFAGAFCVLPSEDQEEFDTLSLGLRAEYRPATVTEQILVEKMAQHLWLSRRAQILQDQLIIDQENFTPEDISRRFALFLRYQTTNDRGFHRCLGELLKLRAEKRKSEIGFERQKQQTEAHQNRERQRADRHKMSMLLAEAKLHRQFLLNTGLEAAKPQPQTLENAA